MVVLHIKLKGMECTITCKQILYPFPHHRPLGWVKRTKYFSSSKSSHITYQMDRKVGHAHTMAIYTMGGWGVWRFSVIW